MAVTGCCLQIHGLDWRSLWERGLHRQSCQATYRLQQLNSPSLVYTRQEYRICFCIKNILRLKLYSPVYRSVTCYGDSPHTRNTYWLTKLIIISKHKRLKKGLSRQKAHVQGELDSFVMTLTCQLSETDQQFQNYSCKRQHLLSRHKGRNALCISSQVCQAALLGLLGRCTVKRHW